MPKIVRQRKFRSLDTKKTLKCQNRDGIDGDNNAENAILVSKPQPLLHNTTELSKRNLNKLETTPSSETYHNGKNKQNTTICSTKQQETSKNKKVVVATKHKNSTTTVEQPTPSLSRGQRKRQAKRDQYMRKEQMVLSSLRLQKANDQAKRIDGLDAIKEALLATVIESTTPLTSQGTTVDTVDKCIVAKSTSFLTTNRGRKQLMEKEVLQMNLVLQHPAFQQDPLATMKEHLRNSIQPSPSTTTTDKSVSTKAKRKRHKTKYRATRTRR